MLRAEFPVGLLLLGSLWAHGAGAGVPPEKPGAITLQPSAAAPVSNSVDARTLVIAETVLDYCAKNDPTGGAKVRA